MAATARHYCVPERPGDDLGVIDKDGVELTRFRVQFAPRSSVNSSPHVSTAVIDLTRN